MLTKHPANLLLRRVLELVGLISLGQWGWNLGEGWLQIAYGFGLPGVIALLWFILRTPNELGNNTGTVISTPGRLRLALETGIFLLCAAVLFDRSQYMLAIFFLFALFLHYIWSAERIVWLSRN